MQRPNSNVRKLCIVVGEIYVFKRTSGIVATITNILKCFRIQGFTTPESLFQHLLQVKQFKSFKKQK